MHIDPITQLITDATMVSSPNYNERPDGADINLLVIHNISLPAGEFGGDEIEQLFCNQLDCGAHPSFADLIGLKVSSHLLIRRDGEIKQFVPLDLRAWHAGVSSFEGVTRCNDYSIGIELEGTDEVPYTEVQYQHLVKISRLLMLYYPGITVERIVGHSDIAPGRKTDPGAAFDWEYFRQRLQKEF